MKQTAEFQVDGSAQLEGITFKIKKRTPQVFQLF